jgi:hypothetical protein
MSLIWPLDFRIHAPLTRYDTQLCCGCTTTLRQAAIVEWHEIPLCWDCMHRFAMRLVLDRYILIHTPGGGLKHIELT